MLAMGFDRQRNVLLLTLLDTFDNGTLAVMDEACATFFDAEGPSHSIFDFTSTQKVVTAPLSLERRAHKPAMCVGFERIIVVPQPELHTLAEKFRLHQSSAGLPAPYVVRTMPEAERLLGLGPLVFKPVDTSWLANDKAKVL
ncbi:MAG: hypothetical protein GEV13_27670 [Rhodospirillales bacterium]|nr:hypothetical protein [Rhodospirillales bacterium]